MKPMVSNRNIQMLPLLSKCFQRTLGRFALMRKGNTDLLHVATKTSWKDTTLNNSRFCQHQEKC